MIHLLDLVLVAILTALLPLYSWREVRKAERELAKPGAAPFNTVREYKRTIFMLVLLAVLCLAPFYVAWKLVNAPRILAAARPRAAWVRTRRAQRDASDRSA